MKLATLLSAMMLALTPVAYAQTVTGSVTGTVADAASSVIVGAQVQLINSTSRQTREFTTSSTGAFEFSSILPGNYSTGYYLTTDPVYGRFHVRGFGGWTRAPEYTTYFRTNQQGLRGPEISPRKPADVLRVLVVGDSFVEAAQVAEEQTFTQRLERSLNSASGAKRRSATTAASTCSTPGRWKAPAWRGSCWRAGKGSSAAIGRRRAASGSTRREPCRRRRARLGGAPIPSKQAQENARSWP